MLAQGSKLSYSYISPNYTVYTKTNNGNNDDENLVNLYEKKVHSWSFAILWQFDCHLKMSQFCTTLDATFTKQIISTRQTRSNNNNQKLNMDWKVVYCA